MKSVEFSSVPDRYKKLPNRIMLVREQIIGLKRPGFIKSIEDRHYGSLSIETLKNVELRGHARETTLTLIWLTVNSLLRERGYEDIDRNVLMSKPVGLEGELRLIIN